MSNPTILSNQMGDGPNMVGCCSTTASNDVHQTFVHEMADLLEHQFGCLVILAKDVGQAGIGVSTDVVR